MDKDNQISAVTIVVDFQIYAYLFKPIVAALVKRGIHVHLYFPKNIQIAIDEHFEKTPLITEHYLDPLKKRFRLRFIIHRVASLLCTRKDFSFSYTKKRNQVNVTSKGINRFLLKLANFTPKVSNQNINGFLHFVAGLFLRNPFPTKTILVGSQNASAELMTARNTSVFTVMESWDHPLNTPCGYRSTHVFVWTEGLGKDWQRCQGDKSWSVFYPLKLRYSIEILAARNRKTPVAGKKTCVYAVASTDKFSGKLIVDIEKRMISDLCVATKKTGWNLLIKPRPNGRVGEFDSFLENYDHVGVTTVTHKDADVPANYIFTDELNELRFNEISHASCIVNAFTTFGLDAAVAGYPVLQLDTQSTPGLEDSAMIFGNNHIKKYLLARENVFTVEDRSLESALTEFLKAGDLSQAENYSAELRQWLIPNQSTTTAISNLIDSVIAKS